MFFDIGAYDPVQISNSYYFELNGWDTYLFEANTNLIDNLTSKRKHVFNYAIAESDKDKITFNVYSQKWHDGWNKVASFSSINLDYLELDRFKDHKTYSHDIIPIEVEQRSLNSLLSNELNHLNKVDVLEIDVEGGEFNCLKGIDIEKYSPTLIVVENMDDVNDELKNYVEGHNYKLDQKYDFHEFYVKL